MKNAAIPTINIDSFIMTTRSDQRGYLKSFNSSSNQHFHICRFSNANCSSLAANSHRYDFYAIYFVERGSFSKMNQSEIKEQEIFFSRPGDIKKWHKSADLEGYVVVFTLDYLLLLMNNKEFLNSFDYLISDHPKKYSLNEENFQFYLSIFRELEKEYKYPEKHSKELIRFRIYMIMIKTNRLHNALYTETLSVQPKKSYDLIYLKFMKLVNKVYSELAKGVIERPLMVKEYAVLLNVNPTYLGECVRKSSGKSAKSILNKQTLLLAKIQLLHSDNNISEIAYGMGFESPGYFIRFFKKFEKITPLEFRNTAFV